MTAVRAEPAAPVRAAQRAERRREDILAAAERVFAEKGFHAAGIADIAAELGLGHGTFYRYFDNKQDIANRVLERVVARIAAPALSEDPEASETAAEYREQTIRILEGMFDLIEREPQVMRFFHGESMVVDSDGLASAVDAYSGYTARFLVNGVAKGFLRPTLDVEVTAQALVGIMLEGTRRALSASDRTEARRRWIDAGVALMFDGIARPERASAASPG